MILHVRDEYDTVLETVLKTEFLTLLSEKYTHLTRTTLSFTFNRRSVFDSCVVSLYISCSSKCSCCVIYSLFYLFIYLFIYLFCSLQFSVKKEGFGGGGTRNLTFHQGNSDFAMLKSSGKTLNVSIGPGLPSNTREYQTPDFL